MVHLLKHGQDHLAMLQQQAEEACEEQMHWHQSTGAEVPMNIIINNPCLSVSPAVHLSVCLDVRCLSICLSVSVQVSLSPAISSPMLRNLDVLSLSLYLSFSPLFLLFLSLYISLSLCLLCVCLSPATEVNG